MTQCRKSLIAQFEPIIKLTVDGTISKFEKKVEIKVNKLVVKILALQGDCAAKDIEIQALKSENTTLETKIGDMAQKTKIQNNIVEWTTLLLSNFR